MGDDQARGGRRRRGGGARPAVRSRELLLLPAPPRVLARSRSSCPAPGGGAVRAVLTLYIRIRAGKCVVASFRTRPSLGVPERLPRADGSRLGLKVPQPGYTALGYARNSVPGPGPALTPGWFDRALNRFEDGVSTPALALTSVEASGHVWPEPFVEDELRLGLLGDPVLQVALHARRFQACGQVDEALELKPQLVATGYRLRVDG